MLSDKFITLTEKFTTFDEAVNAPMLRRCFTLAKKPQKAEINICGLGFYVLWINGKNITKGALAPYISNPDQIKYYDNYDVTDELTEGENVIGVFLGNGMQNCDTRVWDFYKSPFRSSPKLALSYEENGKVIFEADERFKGAPSPITYDDLRSGERYDARLEQEGWNKAGFDDSGWQPAIKAVTDKGEKKICTAPPILPYKELKAVSVRKAMSNGYVYDFGENNAGTARLKIQGKRGQTVDIYFGEIANEEGVQQRNIHIGNSPEDFVQHVRYTLKSDEPEEYTPYFIYLGYQYAEVRGITPEQAGLDLLTYVVMSSQAESAGEFTCSDEIVNRLQANVLRSDRSNFFYFPTDCPHREKNGWTGDAALSAQQFLMNLDLSESLTEWMHSVCLAQRADGAFPGIVPTGGWGFDWGNGPAWDIVITSVPYMLYKINGNLDCFIECAAAVEKYIDYIPTKLDENGLAAYGLGDWCEVNGNTGGAVSTPLVITDTLTLLNLCKQAQTLFNAIGDAKRAQKCKTLFDNLRAAFRKHHFDENTKSVIPATQAGQAMAMYYGAVDKSEMPEALIRLKELIAKFDGHFQVGVLGARVLFRVLSDYGETELAYRMITRPDYPSYAYHVLLGATTLWETFRPMTVKHQFTKWLFTNSDKLSSGSLNHHFWGDVSGWLFEAIGGIRINPDMTDYRDVVIDPKFVSALDYAAATHVYKGYGELKVEWARRSGDVELKVFVPDGINAVYNGKKLKAGKNKFTVKQ